MALHHFRAITKIGQLSEIGFVFMAEAPAGSQTGQNKY